MQREVGEKRSAAMSGEGEYVHTSENSVRGAQKLKKEALGPTRGKRGGVGPA